MAKLPKIANVRRADNQLSIDILLVTDKLKGPQAPVLTVQVGQTIESIPLATNDQVNWLGAMSAEADTFMIFEASCLVKDGGGMDVTIFSPRRNPRKVKATVLDELCATGLIHYRTAQNVIPS